MKVEKQSHAQLRVADAGRNGHESGVYDAFLGCVQASARAVNLPPFPLGRRTLGKLPWVVAEKAVNCVPEVDINQRFQVAAEIDLTVRMRAKFKGVH